MGNEKHQCGLCKHVTIKSKFFGGTKFLCAVQHREVAGGGVCSKYVLDTDKLLQRVGFRSHEYGSSDSCYSCAHCESTQGKMGTAYSCKKMGVRFWSGFSCMDYICDYFQDGGLDALTDRLADLIIEQERHKKESM